MLMKEEFSLAEDDEGYEDVPDWQRSSIEVARRILNDTQGRYLELPGKFEVHEWAIMDRFSDSIEDESVGDDLHWAIRGSGAFRMFKRLLHEYALWDAWNRFRQAELRRMAVEWCEENGVPYHEP